jgi:YD repeat-containing protein
MNFFNFPNKWFPGDAMRSKSLLIVLFIAIYLIINTSLAGGEEVVVYPEIHSVALDLDGYAQQDLMPPGNYITTGVNQAGKKIEFVENTGAQEPDFEVVQADSFTQIESNIAVSMLSISGDSLIVTSGANYQQAVVGRPLDQNFEITLLDANQSPIAGEQITFQVLEGGGSFSGDLTEITMVSDATGKVGTAFTTGEQTSANPYGWLEVDKKIQQVGLNVIDVYWTSDESVRTRLYAYGFPDELVDVKIHYELSDNREWENPPLNNAGLVFLSAQDQYGNFISNTDISVSPGAIIPKDTTSCAKENIDNRPALILPADYGYIDGNVRVPPFAYEQHSEYSGTLLVKSNYMPTMISLYTGGVPDAIYNFNISAGSINKTHYIQTNEFGNCDGTTPPDNDYWLWSRRELSPEVGTTAYIYTWLSRIKENEENDEELAACTVQCSEYIIGTRDYETSPDVSDVVFRINGYELGKTLTAYGYVGVASYIVPAQSYVQFDTSVDFTKETITTTTVESCPCTERGNTPDNIEYFLYSFPLSITTEETKTIPVDADGLLLCDVEFDYEVNVDYVTPLSIKLTLYEEGSEFEVVTLIPGTTEPAVLHQGLQFDPLKTYTAAITVEDLDDDAHNGISSDPIELLFDVEPFKNLYIKNEQDVPVTPAESLQIYADATPEILPEITWSIVNSKPDEDEFPVEAEIDENTGVLGIGINSGFGWVTVRANYLDCIYKEARIRIGCDSCQGSTGCDDGAGSIDLSSIYVKLSLGKTSGGFYAGDLYINEETITPWLYTPGPLRYSSLAPDNEVIYLDDGTLRQVLTGKVFVNIEEIDAFSYRVDFYTSDATDTKVDGVYTILASAVPDVSWLFENPDKSVLLNERFRVSEIRDSSTIVSEYYSTTSSSWSFSKGNGQKIITKTETPVDDLTVETTITKDSSDVVSEHIEKTYQVFPHGKKIIKTAIDPTGDNITSSLQYYDDPALISFGKIKSRENSDGSWHYYEYDGVTGYLVKEYSNYLDQTIDQRQTATITTYSYDTTSFTTEDSGAAEDKNKPREIVISKDGKIVSRVFNVSIRNGDGTLIEKNVRPASQTAAYADADNLLSIKEYYSDQAEGPENGKLKSLLSADGKFTSYTYTQGTYNAAGTQPGSFSADPAGTDTKTEVINGTADTPAGISNKSRNSISIANDFGIQVLAEHYIKTATGQERIGWTTYILNSDGKVAETHYSNGTYSESDWGCCTLSGQTDILGISTQYLYDDLKRRYQESKPSLHGDITTTYSYDSSDKQLSHAVSSGILTRTNSRTYFPSGKIQSLTDSRNFTTSYSYDILGRITIQTSPGNITEITESYPDGRIKSITGTGVIARYYTYGVNADGSTFNLVHMDNAASPVWEKTTRDFLGRTIVVEKPGYSGVESISYSYNQKGQLIKTESENIADFLYEYDQLGAVIRSGLDIDSNGVLASDSMDRITLDDTSVVQESTSLWEVTTKKVLPNDNDPYEKTISTHKTRLTGLGTGGLVNETISIDIFGNNTIQRNHVDRGLHQTTAVTDFPDATIDAVALSGFGLLVSSSDQAGITTLFDYDTLGRRISITDPRLGTSLTHYNTLGQIDYTEDAAAHRTTYGYDSATGRKISETTDSQTVYFQHDTLGNITHTWGATYPVQYIFDPYGRRTEMHTYKTKGVWDQDTWPAAPGTPAITRWHYHDASGLLASKEDDQGKSTNYTYSSGGKLHTRTWARIVDANPVVTTYSYDPDTGQLSGTDYSDTTSDISFVYNRLGLKKTITDALGTRSFAYNGNLQNYEETLSGSLNRTISKTFETVGIIGRSKGVSFDLDYTVSYGYDISSGRFDTVSWQVGNAIDAATYSFADNSHLIKDLIYNSGTKSLYDFEPQRDIRNQVKNQFNETLISQYDYSYDPLGRVKSMTTPDAVFASYLPAGQGNTIDFSKSLDVAYAVNSVNQYTEISRNSVQTALNYDDDGNILTDAALTYTWNAENRLIAVEPSTLLVEGEKKLEFVYDYMGRRVEKKVFTHFFGDYSLSATTKYLYNGWNLIAELDENGTTQAAYIWGLDLSQSLQGAGGIGGLLARVDPAADKTPVPV